MVHLWAEFCKQLSHFRGAGGKKGHLAPSLVKARHYNPTVKCINRNDTAKYLRRIGEIK